MNSLDSSFLYSASLVWPRITSSMSVCGELLRLDLVLLRRAQQVVEEGDVQLQHLDELDDAAVGDVELAVEVEGARIAVRAELGDLPVVDVAGQLGRVLVLLVLGLERADADAVLLGQDQAPHPHVLDHLRPVAFVVRHQLAEDQAAGRVEVAFDVDVRLAGDVDAQLGRAPSRATRAGSGAAAPRASGT